MMRVGGQNGRCSAEGAPFGPSQIQASVFVPVRLDVTHLHLFHAIGTSPSKCCPTVSLTSAGVVIYIYSQCVEGRFAFVTRPPFLHLKSDSQPAVPLPKADEVMPEVMPHAGNALPVWSRIISYAKLPE